MKPKPTMIVDDETYFDQLDQTDFIHMPYDQQLIIKHEHVKKIFEDKGIFEVVNPVIQAETPRHYRHKVTVTATNLKVHGKPQIKFGFYMEKTHKIKPVFESLLHDEAIEKTLKDIEDILQKNHFSGYVKGQSRGIIKHVLIRKSFATKDMLLVFVTHGHVFPNAKQIIHAIREKNPHVKSVVQIIQRIDTPIVLYGEDHLLFGPGYIEDHIGEFRFRLSAKSFYQINPKQMLRLYETAFEFSNIHQNERVMDCYSGIGTLSLLAAMKAKEVIAIEVNQSAVKDAIENAKRNHVTHVSFIKDDVEKFIASYEKDVDVLLLDPPRSGVSMAFVSSVKRLKPKRIVYISCFPETQARDVSQWCDSYSITYIQPVDMFPYTSHVECIVLLQLKL